MRNLQVRRRATLVTAALAVTAGSLAPTAQVKTNVPDPVAGAKPAIDVGDQDGLRIDAGRLHEAFDQYGIANTFEIYPGTHTSDVAVRFQEHVVPFFSRTLSFEPARRP